MKVKKKTVYFCDLCGDEIKEDHCFIKAKISEVYVDSNDNRLKIKKPLDVCYQCREKIFMIYRSEKLKNDKNIL